MRILVLHDPQTKLHQSVELLGHKLIPAHEAPDRIDRILDALKTASSSNWEIREIALSEDKPTWPEIPPTIHSPEYITHLRTIFERFVSDGIVDVDDPDACVLPECFPHARLLEAVGEGANAIREFKLPRDPYAHLGHYSFDMSAGISKATFRSVMASVNLAIQGADLLLQDLATPSLVFALCRPPGHHACHSLAGGYCYINNVAVVTEYLLSRLPPTPEGSIPTPRIAIFDLDFHHGNGTQAVFFSRRSPAYVSIHGEGEYPYYTGAEDEVGSGEGKGFTRNFPLPSHRGSTKEDYFRKLDEAVRVIAEEWRAEVVVLSLGFDTFNADPLGGFDLGEEDYTEMGRRVRSLGLPVLALLEGGYHALLGTLVVRFLKGFDA